MVPTIVLSLLTSHILAKLSTIGFASCCKFIKLNTATYQLPSNTFHETLFSITVENYFPSSVYNARLMHQKRSRRSRRGQCLDEAVTSASKPSFFYLFISSRIMRWRRRRRRRLRRIQQRPP